MLKYLRNECLFFLGSWEMNRSAEQTNRVNREPYIYNASNKDPF